MTTTYKSDNSSDEDHSDNNLQGLSTKMSHFFMICPSLSRVNFVQKGLSLTKMSHSIPQNNLNCIQFAVNKRKLLKHFKRKGGKTQRAKSKNFRESKRKRKKQEKGQVLKRENLKT